MKAICLFSGGLDSILSTRLIQLQGIEPVAVYFETPFFPSAKASKVAKALGINLLVWDVLEEYLDILKNPAHGYGSQMNPCIDCHAFMLRKAKERMEELGASFVVTGEVLGQRPMSQNRAALRLIEKLSGLEGLILRPLSARLLPETRPEKEGWVKRESLLDISGRSRKAQLELARVMGIKEIPTPAGGCLLTDPIFAKRLRDLIEHGSNLERWEIELLKVGRHMRLDRETKLTVGRNEKENSRILELCQGKAVIIETLDVPGPVSVLVGRITEEILEKAIEITMAYSDLKGDDKGHVRIISNSITFEKECRGVDKSRFQGLMI